MRSMLDRLEAEVTALAAVDPAGLPVGGLQDLVARTTAASARLDGIGSRALGELQVRTGGTVPDGVDGAAAAVCPLPAWLRVVAGASGTAAGRRVRTSVALRELPAVVAAVIDGLISPAHARVLSRLVGSIDAQALLDSQAALIEVAGRTDPDQLASYVRHLLATWCEPQLDAQEHAAEDRRFFALRNTHNGSWRGSFELPDAAMEIILTALEPLSRRDGLTDHRTAGQRRADALTDIFGLTLRHADLPDAGGARPRLTYVLPGAPGPHPAVVDPDRHPGTDCPSGPWTGPATRAQIEAILCHARTELAVLNPAGQVIRLISLTDQITTGQRRAVAARDRCCTAKGCTRPPAFCDVHHLRALADGGTTDLDNLVLLCRRHHVMWHRQLLDLTHLRTTWLRLPQPRAPALS